MNALSSLLSRLGRPAVLAHRGASRAAPENSLRALELAAGLGADGAEFDVQRCATGELFVFHDRTLARCTGRPGTLTETSLDVLRSLTLDAIDPERRAEPIPTLDEYLARAGGLFLNLEVKADVLAETDIARACVDALARAGRAGTSLVSSFHPAALVHAAARRPRVARGALVDASRGWRTRLALGLGALPVAVHPEHTLVTASRVRAWHRLGLLVATWTVDDPVEARRCLTAGVDAVITNRPDVVRPLAEDFPRQSSSAASSASSSAERTSSSKP